MITVILVIYKTDKKLLNDFFKKINNKYKVIIIDNSLNYNFKDISLPKTHKILRSKNRGNGSGINFGLKYTNTKYAIYFDTDTYFHKDFISKFFNIAKKIKNFCMLVPNHGNIVSKNNYVEKYTGEASIMFFNVKKLKKLGNFDENFFLYFEESDLMLRCKRKKEKIYFIKNLKIKHKRASSISKKINISHLREWHYMWSMFYFYKKNYSYFFAVKKTYHFILKDLFVIVISILFLNYKTIRLRFFRLFGIISSMLGLNSFLRP